MTPFLSTMTSVGHELVTSVRDARTAADIGAVMEKYKNAVLPALLEGRLVLSDADEFAFGCALATYLPGSARQRAMHWETAALTAQRAKAYAEALAALIKAEEMAHSKERQERIRLLRELLVARGELAAEDLNSRTANARPKRSRSNRPSVRA